MGILSRLSARFGAFRVLADRFQPTQDYPARARGELLEQRFVLSAPHLVSAVFDDSVSPNQLRFTFDQDVSASLTPANLTIENVTTDEQFTPANASSPTSETFRGTEAMTRLL